MIELRDVRLAYGTRPVLDGISLTVEDARITAILGPSGSGKSTILKVMLGLLRVDEGHVFVDGADISGMRESELFPIRRTMGMVFQGNALFDSMNVVENMGFFLRENLQLPSLEIQQRVREQIRFAGLEGYEGHLPDTLSGGMRKRLAIGRALIFDPTFVLLDEPTAGLDPLNTRRVLSLVSSLRRERGLGAVMVTHLISDVFDIADKVIVLYQGKIIFEDAPSMMESADHPFIASFLEDPERMELVDNQSLVHG